jgi:hypothetical protein
VARPPLGKCWHLSLKISNGVHIKPNHVTSASDSRDFCVIFVVRRAALLQKVIKIPGSDRQILDVSLIRPALHLSGIDLDLDQSHENLGPSRVVTDNGLAVSTSIDDARAGAARDRLAPRV